MQRLSIITALAVLLSAIPHTQEPATPVDIPAWVAVELKAKPRPQIISIRVSGNRTDRAMTGLSEFGRRL